MLVGCFSQPPFLRRCAQTNVIFACFWGLFWNLFWISFLRHNCCSWGVWCANTPFHSLNMDEAFPCQGPNLQGNVRSGVYDHLHFREIQTRDENPSTFDLSCCYRYWRPLKTSVNVFGTHVQTNECTHAFQVFQHIHIWGQTFLAIKDVFAMLTEDEMVTWPIGPIWVACSKVLPLELAHERQTHIKTTQKGFCPPSTLPTPGTLLFEGVWGGITPKSHQTPPIEVFRPQVCCLYMKSPYMKSLRNRWEAGIIL